MKTAQQHLNQYAEYHRSRRNIATHLIGIPLIVYAIVVLLSRPVFNSFGITPAWVLLMLTLAYYLTLEFRLGLAAMVWMLPALALGKWAAALPTDEWLVIGIGLFVIGWAFQFVGHYFEGKKPAFVDDLMGLMIGPLFVTADVLFHYGICKDLEAKIIAHAGELKH